MQWPCLSTCCRKGTSDKGFFLCFGRLLCHLFIRNNWRSNVRYNHSSSSSCCLPTSDITTFLCDRYLKETRTFLPEHRWCGAKQPICLPRGAQRTEVRSNNHSSHFEKVLLRQTYFYCDIGFAVGWKRKSKTLSQIVVLKMWSNNKIDICATLRFGAFA